MIDRSLGLFEGFGIELEYMIVDRETGAVKPIADQLLRTPLGYESEVEHGPLAWSNELVLHVIELKTNGPVNTLHGIAETFQAHVRQINRQLEMLGARLMPTGMHPSMDPATETHLWPHEYNAVYETFNRIFDCSGHGWANLQSAHINLPFADDGEFARLHTAIRLVLPIIPALASSSPLVDGRLSPYLDTRLEVYRKNALRVPSVMGLVIPEPVTSEQEYQTEILERIYADLAPHDPAGTLRYEWVNARGAIARFDRNTIEIRVIDVQECPAADLAIVAAIVSVLKALCEERTSSLAHQRAISTELLAGLLLRTIEAADAAEIEDAELLEVFGVSARGGCTVGELWRHLLEAHAGNPELVEWEQALEVILNEGPLARRVSRRLGSDVQPRRIRQVYDELCDCLETGSMFRFDG